MKITAIPCKICIRCGLNHPISPQFFQRDKQKFDGLSPYCKLCKKGLRHGGYLRRREKEIARTRQREKENWHKVYERKRQYKRRFPEQDRLSAAKYRAQKREQLNAKDRQRIKASPGKNAAKSAMARAQRRRAAPPWLTKEQKAEMTRLYVEAACIGYHVDHIYPICRENFSGLHVPWNLQLLSPIENLKKGNRFVSTS